MSTRTRNLVKAQGNRYWARQIGREMMAEIGLPYEAGETQQMAYILGTVEEVCGESVVIREKDGSTHLVDPSKVHEIAD